MNKQEALEHLKDAGAEMSARTFLRHVASEKIGVDHTRNVADYDPEGVRRLADKLTKRSYVSREPGQTALTVPERDNGLSQHGAGGAEEALERVLSRVAAVTMAAALVEPAPSVWLTIEQAAQWLGLPRRRIDEALRDERNRVTDGRTRTIRLLGSGPGLRLHSADVRNYFE